MEIALYAPDFGYYSKPNERKIGRKGDFYTSVSVGETFGLLLAHRIVQEQKTFFDGEKSLVIVEQGAHDGQLARDIVGGLQEIVGDDALEIEYRIIEPREPVRRFLTDELDRDGFAKKIRVVSSVEEARADRGIFLSNELLDAFPVALIERAGENWRERTVCIDEETGTPAWSHRELSAELGEMFRPLDLEYQEGYLTEICPGVDSWISEMAGLFDKGLWWIIDYGYEEEDYYSPHRSDGTLRCYEKHEATDDPLRKPGEIDITAHVNFSHLERAALASGLKRRRFTDQNHFLVESAKPWLMSLEGRAPDAAAAARLRQFQTLTHPGLMGQQFKVMELEKNSDR